MAHIGEEGGFGAVGSLCLTAGGLECGLLITLWGDVAPQADAATIRGAVVLLFDLSLIHI